MENKLKNNLLMFFKKIYYKNEKQILQIKKLNKNEIEKNLIS